MNSAGGQHLHDRCALNDEAKANIPKTSCWSTFPQTIGMTCFLKDIKLDGRFSTNLLISAMIAKGAKICGQQITGGYTALVTD